MYIIFRDVYKICLDTIQFSLFNALSTHEPSTAWHNYDWLSVMLWQLVCMKIPEGHPHYGKSYLQQS